MAKDLLIWVGGSYYSEESFAKEARKLGCCRRVNAKPDIVLGESRAFLISEVYEGAPGIERVSPVKLRPKSKNPPYLRITKKKRQATQPRVFGYFAIDGITFVKGPGVSIPEILKKAGVKAFAYNSKGFSEIRGCGFVKTGGIYLVDNLQLRRLEDVSVKDVKGDLKLITPPIPVRIKRFRGFKYVNGDKILNRQPAKTWKLKSS